MKIMDRYQVTSALVFVLLLQGCSHPGLQQQTLRQGDSAPGSSPRLLAVYEPWFGHPRHISVGYSSQDPAVIQKQIDQAKTIGISGFVVDWYGESRPYSDHNFGLLQAAASESHFQVALLYNESEDQDAEAFERDFGG